MVTPEIVRELALSLEGTAERDHCGIPSFRVRKIYATLWPDEGYVHLMLNPEIQHELLMESPEAFMQIPNKWGLSGTTRVFLDKISSDEMLIILRLAWELALPQKKRR